MLSFIVAFGLAKALTNLGAGAFAARLGRRRLLIAGWVVALPVPVLIAVAPSWEWIVAANVLLGINQGLAWSMTVVMKIDLVGPQRRGFALGLNEAAGYGGVALAAAASRLARRRASRPATCSSSPARRSRWSALVVSVAASCATPRPCRARAGRTTTRRARPRCACLPDATGVPALRACSQAGLVNNLNDALAWGLVPLFLAADGASVGQIGLVAGLYPAVWGDRPDLDRALVRPRRAQAADRQRDARCRPLALAVLALSDGAVAVAAVERGGARRRDRARVPDADRRDRRRRLTGRARAPSSASTASGATWATSPAACRRRRADALGFGGAIAVVAALTAASGLWVALEMPYDGPTDA